MSLKPRARLAPASLLGWHVRRTLAGLVVFLAAAALVQACSDVLAEQVR